jgi:hypothetical protein
MFWAIASSVFVIYLYRTQDAKMGSVSDTARPDPFEAELAELNASIAALEAKVAKMSSAEAKP